MALNGVPSDAESLQTLNDVIVYSIDLDLVLERQIGARLQDSSVKGKISPLVASKTGQSISRPNNHANVQQLLTKFEVGSSNFQGDTSQQKQASVVHETYETVVIDRGDANNSFGFELSEHADGAKSVSFVDNSAPAGGRLRVGDIVYAINGDPTDVKDLPSIVDSLSTSTVAEFVVERQQPSHISQTLFSPRSFGGAPETSFSVLSQSRNSPAISPMMATKQPPAVSLKPTATIVAASKQPRIPPPISPKPSRKPGTKTSMPSALQSKGRAPPVSPKPEKSKVPSSSGIHEIFSARSLGRRWKTQTSPTSFPGFDATDVQLVSATLERATLQHSFGFEITELADKTIVISGVDPSGIAAGKFFTGDYLVGVNNLDVDDLNLDAVIGVINSGLAVVITVEHPIDLEDSGLPTEQVAFNQVEDPCSNERNTSLSVHELAEGNWPLDIPAPPGPAPRTSYMTGFSSKPNARKLHAGVTPAQRKGPPKTGASLGPMLSPQQKLLLSLRTINEDKKVESNTIAAAATRAKQARENAAASSHGVPGPFLGLPAQESIPLKIVPLVDALSPDTATDKDHRRATKENKKRSKKASKLFTASIKRAKKKGTQRSTSPRARLSQSTKLPQEYKVRKVKLYRGQNGSMEVDLLQISNTSAQKRGKRTLVIAGVGAYALFDPHDKTVHVGDELLEINDEQVSSM